MRGSHTVWITCLLLIAPALNARAQGGDPPVVGTPRVAAEVFGAGWSDSHDPSQASPENDTFLFERLRAIEAELALLRDQHASGTSPSDAEPLGQVICGECQSTDCGGLCGRAVKGPAKRKFPTVELTGFFHLDAGLYHQSAMNRATLGDIQDGLGFRRARLGAKGKVTENTAYLMEFDFAQAQARFVDVWMEFEQTPLGKLRIGRFRQPMGMTELTSARELPFLERPLLFPLGPFRQTGMMLHDTAWDESMTWAISGYRFLSDNYGNVYGDDGGYGFTTRLTGLLVDRGDDGLVHLGGGYSFNDPARDAIQYATTNEFFAGQNPLLGPGGWDTLPIDAVPPFVNTGVVDAAHTSVVNLEGAISTGRFLLQSEVRWAELKNLDGTRNTFPGAYAHARYVLTGETIPYNRSSGVFGRVRPANPVNLSRGCWGAWEFAARVSHLDLNGEALPGPGRRLTDTTLGLNWYVNAYTKFQLNWIHADLDDPILGGSTAETFAWRGQLDF